jgi:heme-degrading monooxygenase HmoA
MHARVTRLEGSPDRVDTGIKMINEQIIPEAKKISGFAGGYWCIDRSTGKGVSLTLWESEEAMKASEDRAAQMRKDAADEMGAADMMVERYEVVGRA